MARSDKKNTTCASCGYKFTRPAKLRQHYQSNKNQCNKPPEDNTPTPIPRPQSPPPAPVVHARGKNRRKEKPEPIQTPILQDKNQENDPEAGPGPSTQEYRERRHSKDTQDEEAFEEIIPQVGEPSEVERQYDQEQSRITLDRAQDHTGIDKIRKNVNDYEVLKELDMIEEAETEELMGYWAGMKKIANIEDHAPEGDIRFEEGPVGRDLERPHQNRSLMSKWEAIVPRLSNPAYAFNGMVEGAKKYKEIPYMPKLIASARQEMIRVFQTEFRRKEQIKSTIVAKCIYYKKEKKDRSDNSAPDIIKIAEKWHRGKMQALLSENYIDEHLTSSGGEIDKKIEEYLENGSNWILVRIDIVYIEAYTLRRTTGGSYEPTPKKLANKKSTINPDNKGLVDPETNALSEKCLQGALGCYFAYQDGHTDNLERIFQATKYKPYLDVVKLDGIPMPTPICTSIFNKIEEMNPDISINVWGWNEETATPKAEIASKNWDRPYIIDLLALTNIVKSEDTDKYGQKNHFLWIKNIDRLLYGDTAHKEKKHLCRRCTITFPSKKSLDHHREHCFSSRTMAG
ncbi:hypothetical protein GLOIN_2v1480811 [Rhizophagus clarus]|uniref:C2H2-type domain-containing protein n=1 Tax=Rhizophagus clarus TaxID=94130 RepID=A0A8H3KWC5_9GLOM|nr:hypothetical protein GLOIN_2v1480811 [Rhizophagus clarus]